MNTDSIENTKLYEDDLLLARACARGENEALDTLYRNFGGKILGICMRYASNKEEALDCLHDGFLKVFEKIEMYSGRGSLYTWVKTVIVNRTINTLAAKNGIIEIGFNDELEFALEEWQEPDLEPEQVLKCIGELPPGYRMVLNMYVFEKMTHNEIAEKLKISSNTSRTQLLKARKKLKDLLKKC